MDIMNQSDSLKQRYERYGLIDILSLEPSIVSDVRYATSNNFTGKI